MSFSEFLRDHRQSIDDEHRKVFRIQLQALWETLKRSEAANEEKNASLATQLEKLFAKNENDFSWLDGNTAQLHLLPFLSDSALKAQFMRFTDKSLALAIINAEQHASRLEKLDSLDGTALSEHCRVVLEELQMAYISVRFIRDKRMQAARQLLLIFSVVLVLALLPIIAFSAAPAASAEVSKLTIFKDPLYGMTSAGLYGIVGAFFSRLMPFQDRITSLRYDDIFAMFTPRFIAVRCAIGLLAAAIFYLFMRSGLVGGGLFPRMDGVESAGSGEKLLPSAEYAKLLVWSFIAGWSERLVPETLETTQASLKKEIEKELTPQR